MTTAIQTVDELLTEIRDQTDESATEDLSDNYFLRCLNRGQQKLVRLAGRKYEPMFQSEANVTADSSGELTIPEASYGLVVDQIQVKSGNSYFPVSIVALRELEGLENDSVNSAYPLYAAQQGNKLKLYPKATSGTICRVRYQARPPKLVKSQGRITTIDTDNNQLVVDSLGSDLTTDISELKAFVNVVDSTTGKVKGTYQVTDIDTSEKQVTIKTTSLSRSTVFGRTVSTSLSTDIEQDDYICIANGTCVPELVADYSDYLIAYAVLEATRKNKEDSSAEFAHLKDIEDDIRNMWAGRAAGKRVSRKNPYWSRRVPLIYRYQ